MQSKIEQQVMAGVGVVYAGRQLTSLTAFKIYALAACTWALASLVWVARIEQNFAEVLRGGASKVLPYAAYSVAHTTLFVQLALVVATVALVSLCVDMVRKLSSQSRLAY